MECAASGHVYIIVLSAAPEAVYTTEAFASPGDAYTTLYRGLNCIWTVVGKNQSLMCKAMIFPL
jgi:hypothetical protein